MKKCVLFLSVTVFFTACEPKQAEDPNAISTDLIDVPATASGVKADGTSPAMTFTEEKHDFGKVTQGEKVSYSFSFKNTGGSDLIISSAQGSCGCTVPSFPKTPIKPGQTEKVDIVFDSADKSGKVQKTVTLVTNCNPSTKVLTISATIDVPSEK